MSGSEKTPHTTVAVVLPVCLHLDTRPFYVPYKHGTCIEMRTENISSRAVTFLGTGTNIEVDSDEFSHFRFTRVSLKVPYCGETLLDHSTFREALKDTVFAALNTFIDAARIELGRHGLKDYHDWDDFVGPVITKPPDDLNPSRIQTAFIPFGKGVCAPAKPLRSEEEHVRLQERIRKGISLGDRFLCDARRESYYRNYISALLTTVIALEIAVSDVIADIARKKGVDKDSIKRFLVDVGLTGNIKTTLKLLVPDTASLPADGIFEKCKAAITIRNKILHEGLRNVSERDASDALQGIEPMVAFCRSLLAMYIADEPEGTNPLRI